ncbi:MAG: hypothetical protein L0Y58_13700 [Verrucomicrobia subdivision 3 bacterium]|nr:hypothetical protein [Limisphaerales bacterium]
MPDNLKITICVLTYGDFLWLAHRAIECIRRHCPRSAYSLVVGANAVGTKTRAYLESLHTAGEIDHFIDSPVNLNKCPMMRQMFERVETELIWWFDDDSYVAERGVLQQWRNVAKSVSDSTAMWGQLAWCDDTRAFAPELDDPVGFVRSAGWYRGLPPPSWKPGGKGVFDFEGRGTGDGRWFFILGGCWMIRTSTIRALDWPDKRLVKMGDDVFLGEAIRQNGWDLADIGTPGVALDTEPRRGDPGFANPPAFCPVAC